MVISIAGPAGWRHKLTSEKSIVWGGIVFPVVTLTALLIYGFLILKAGGTLAQAENPVRISVVGEQWWWRVIYRHDDGHTTESANELRIPTGRPIEIELSTADVIHSFWIPAYAGKVDMIPGRTNILHFIADKPGIVTGQCAEYCGGAHALMSFYTVAMTPSDYDAWLAKERTDAKPALAQRRRTGLFIQRMRWLPYGSRHPGGRKDRAGFDSCRQQAVARCRYSAKYDGRLCQMD